jgi:glucose/arabinose dehydrogenase
LSLRIAPALAACALAAAGCGGSDQADATRESPSEPALELVGEFTEPVFLAEPPRGDGTLYVVERGGTVRALAADGKVARRPFIDISADVDTEGEGGLFSIAFDPRRSRVFVAYSAKGRLVVERLEWGPGATAADPASRRELISIPHPHPIHWGGLLMFAPDGSLFLGTGEGGPVVPLSSRAQDPDDPLGKLLRIDPETGRARIVATGLRNPWRYSFDRETGDIWIGDVGDFTQEEVDHVRASRLDGANFGWPAREGTAGTKSELRPPPGAVEPTLTYTRTGKEDEARCAITGGYVVRDPALGTLEGKYLYGDFCVGEILSYEPEGGRPEETGLEVPKLASFAEDTDGRVYAISLDGPIYRLVEE